MITSHYIVTALIVLRAVLPFSADLYHPRFMWTHPGEVWAPSIGIFDEGEIMQPVLLQPNVTFLVISFLLNSNIHEM